MWCGEAWRARARRQDGHDPIRANRVIRGGSAACRSQVETRVPFTPDSIMFCNGTEVAPWRQNTAIPGNKMVNALAAEAPTLHLSTWPRRA